MSPSRISPVTVELIRNGFVAAAMEMSVCLFRGAHTPVIYEAKDCSVGIHDATGRVLGQAPGLPIFLGNMQACIEHVIDKFGAENLADGDVFILNDAYVQGSHLTDITVLSPIFFDGRLVAFAATRADGGHLGGKDLGVSSDTIHIYQEGLRIPAMRLVKAGVRDEGLLELLALNSFFHSARIGDLDAQIAACHRGGERVAAIYRKYGTDAVATATAEIFGQGEQLDREAVLSIPDGTYRAAGWIDNDGVTDERVRVEVAVTVSDDQLTIDLSGSNGATRGPVNSGRVQAVSACRVAFKSLIHPHTAVTGGNFGNLTVIVPEGSVFDASEPSPVQWYYTPLGLLIDLVQQALAPALPGAVAAAHFGDSMIVSFAGTSGADDDARDFVLISAEVGGWGGFEGSDGQDAMINVINGDFKNLPIEFVEHNFPLVVENYALRSDSAGNGRWRGGLGVTKTFRVEQDGTVVSLWLDRSVTPAWGLFGGGPAVGPVAIVDPGSEQEMHFNKVSDLRLSRGQRVQVNTGGGGGFGDPHQRDPQAVAADVARGYISRAQAALAYGWEPQPD